MSGFLQPMSDDALVRMDSEVVRACLFLSFLGFRLEMNHMYSGYFDSKTPALSTWGERLQYLMGAISFRSIRNI